jgi:hypothetical protein
MDQFVGAGCVTGIIHSVPVRNDVFFSDLFFSLIFRYIRMFLGRQIWYKQKCSIQKINDEGIVSRYR